MNDYNPLAVFLLPWIIPEGSSDLEVAIRQGFAWMIFGATIVSGLLVAGYDKRSIWEKKWQEFLQLGRSQESPALEQASIAEVGLIIRTAPEALASNLPGVVLLLGLLGTFIGLGLALTEASLALTTNDANQASTALANMMSGLGYKFATSTWGILAYLSLRIWNAIIGFEEQRLVFSADKVQKALESFRVNRLQRANDQRAHWTKLINHIVVSSAGTQSVLSEFLKGVKENIEQMSKSSQLMASSAQSVSRSSVQLGSAATNLGDTVNRLDDGVKKTLEEVKIGLNEAIEDLSSTTTSSMDSISQNLGNVTINLAETLSSIKGELNLTLNSMARMTKESNDQIAVSLTGLSTTVDKTLAELQITMKEAMETNQKGHRNFAAATEDILSVNHTTKSLVEAIQNKILEALESVATSNYKTRELFSCFESIARQNELTSRALVEALRSYHVSPSTPAQYSQEPVEPIERAGLQSD